MREDPKMTLHFKRMSFQISRDGERIFRLELPVEPDADERAATKRALELYLNARFREHGPFEAEIISDAATSSIAARCEIGDAVFVARSLL